MMKILQCNDNWMNLEINPLCEEDALHIRIPRDHLIFSRLARIHASGALRLLMATRKMRIGLNVMLTSTAHKQDMLMPCPSHPLTHRWWMPLHMRAPHSKRLQVVVVPKMVSHKFNLLINTCLVLGQLTYLT
ncbi:hypothetical protein I7I51_08252 [Histoplasma capsulatum]|uniref:Uncharacterized protein n=1 Tax=Ajellomyces capsulatus TaxID=5037 RepID=A0A8A1M235_AJECA|nr:hypothetical protein I7I51_08252 [Histoplasma capsulatum]